MFEQGRRVKFNQVTLKKFIDMLQVRFPEDMKVHCDGLDVFFCHADLKQKVMSFDTDELEEEYKEEETNKMKDLYGYHAETNGETRIVLAGLQEDEKISREMIAELLNRIDLDHTITGIEVGHEANNVIVIHWTSHSYEVIDKRKISSTSTSSTPTVATVLCHDGTTIGGT